MPACARFGEAGHQQRRAHVDRRIGDHQLGVGPCDQPVVRRWRGDLVRREAALQPGSADFARRRRNKLDHSSPDSAIAWRGVWPQCAAGRRLVERIDRDRPEHAELDRHRLLESGAALRLRHVMGERRPWQRDAGALRLGRGRLRFGAAHRGDAAFAARNALRRLVQIADRAFAADRAVIGVLRRDAEPLPRAALPDRDSASSGN